MPIKGLSEQRRLPRLGKIRLGVKVEKIDRETGKPALNKKTGEVITYPRATEYFVLPRELSAIYGETCTELPIMIPTEDDEVWANQYYKRYSSSRGLVCRGDGATCRRMLDVATGAIADRNTKEVVWKEGLPCNGVKCPDYQAKPQICKEVMNLQFIMPDVPGLGVWQVDTSSINSIRNINSAAAMVRAVYKRLAFIPLCLTIEPVEVVNPDDGKKKTVRVLNLRVRGTMRELMGLATRPYTELLLPPPVEEAPDDNAGESETKVVEGHVVIPITSKEVDALYGKDTDANREAAAPRTAPQPVKPVSPTTADQDFDKLQAAERPKAERPKRDPTTIKTGSDLFKACREDWKLTPAQVLKELNVDSTVELADLADAYRKIATVR